MDFVFTILTHKPAKSRGMEGRGKGEEEGERKREEEGERRGEEEGERKGKRKEKGERE